MLCCLQQKEIGHSSTAKCYIRNPHDQTLTHSLKMIPHKVYAMPFSSESSGIQLLEIM